FRFVLGAAATLLLAVLGAGISTLIVEGDLPFPGSPLRLFPPGTPSQAMFGLPADERRDGSSIVADNHLKESPLQLRSDVALDDSGSMSNQNPVQYKDTKQAEAHSPAGTPDNGQKYKLGNGPLDSFAFDRPLFTKDSHLDDERT